MKVVNVDLQQGILRRPHSNGQLKMFISSRKGTPHNQTCTPKRGVYQGGPAAVPNSQHFTMLETFVNKNSLTVEALKIGRDSIKKKVEDLRGELLLTACGTAMQ